MADVYFNCVCGKSLAVDERGVGLTVKCVDCGQPVKVPEVEIEFACEGCKVVLLAPITVGGDRIKCALCGHRMTAPRPGIDIRLAQADRLGYARSGFQVRRRSVPVPAPAGIAWRQPVRLMFRVALVVSALAVGTAMVQWYISAHRAEMYGQKRPPVLIQEVSVREVPVQDAEDKPAVRQTVQAPSAIQTAEPVEKSDEGTIPALSGVSDREPARSGNAVSVVASPGFIEPKVRLSRSAPIQRARAEQSELMRKFMALDALRVKLSGQNQTGVYMEGLKQFRKIVDAYGKEHEGNELEDAAWDVVFRHTYEFIGKYGCVTYGDSERLVREGYDVLTEIEPSCWRWPYTLLIDLVAGHVERWQDREPFLTANLLDAMAANVLGMNDKELTRYWYWRTGYQQVRFMWRSEEIAHVQREGFYRGREQAALACLNNDLVAPARRTAVLSDWARYLVRNGRPDKAAQVVNAWRQRHGAAVYNADFCRIWLETALFAKGDWDEADQALREATQRAAKWTKPSDRRQYELMCQMYYENWFWPGFELQRRRWAEVKKASCMNGAKSAMRNARRTLCGMRADRHGYTGWEEEAHES